MVILKKGMKAVIENKDNLYLIRIYKDDDFLVDAYTVKKICELRKSTLKRYLKKKQKK